MRLLCALVLGPLLFVLFSALGAGEAAALQPACLSPAPERSLVREVAIKCGTFDGQFTCKHVPGGVARGKNATPGQIETTPESPEGNPWQGNTQQDALPPATGGAGTAAQTPPTSCPENSELLGGHCIPYTQRCSAGIPPNGQPPQCQGAEEKQVCNFHADGSKDCCCRIYSKF